MLEELLTSLTAALTQSLLVALFGAFLWGVISILLSPCHLASIPLLIGFLTSESKSGSRRVFQLSLLFSLGILAVHSPDRRDHRRCGAAPWRSGKGREWGCSSGVSPIRLLPDGPAPTPVEFARHADAISGRRGSAYFRLSIRHRPRSMHVCLHGAGAGSGFRQGRKQSG